MNQYSLMWIPAEIEIQNSRNLVYHSYMLHCPQYPVNHLHISHRSIIHFPLAEIFSIYIYMKFGGNIHSYKKARTAKSIQTKHIHAESLSLSPTVLIHIVYKSIGIAAFTHAWTRYIYNFTTIERPAKQRERQKEWERESEREREKEHSHHTNSNSISIYSIYRIHIFVYEGT